MSTGWCRGALPPRPQADDGDKAPLCPGALSQAWALSERPLSFNRRTTQEGRFRVTLILHFHRQDTQRGSGRRWVAHPTSRSRRQAPRVPPGPRGRAAGPTSPGLLRVPGAAVFWGAGAVGKPPSPMSWGCGRVWEAHLLLLCALHKTRLGGEVGTPQPGKQTENGSKGGFPALNSTKQTPTCSRGGTVAPLQPSHPPEAPVQHPLCRLGVLGSREAGRAPLCPLLSQRPARCSHFANQIPSPS